MPLFRSLRARVLFWVSVAFTVLFAITIVALDRAFASSTERAVRELLQVQLLGLVALAEATPEGTLTLPEDAVAAANPQFGVADSGLYGVLWDADGVPVWTSSSLLDRELSVPKWPAPGEQDYVLIDTPQLPRLEALLEGVTWEFSEGNAPRYTFAVAVSLEPYDERQAAFRRNLIGWFTGVTVTMLLVIVGLLTFVLRPLHRLERQVREVEAGARSRLSGRMPTELVGLASNLNALVETERRRLVKYRNTLDDLAHSLKTPLAAMRTLLAEARDPAKGSLDESLNRELDRMDQRVSYQLRRARASGATGLGVEPVAVAPLIHELVETLDKVYRDKRVSCELELARSATFRGDSGDLTEIIGNLLDNAYKYCKQRVLVTLRGGPGSLTITIADDGPGIGSDVLPRLLERGIRADESVPGQGIGLAVVRETVELYNGSLRFGASSLGGAAVTVELARPGAIGG
jgi:two-component system sensor histidine kinase PhoQ